ncbi:hypothetical protein M5K25_010889 [Dendrobium thyrsiflorum]|uniref:Uncharacterized protein n=1 Tax=Dendrobium thyrsiflorum TaxID=117978 RepID=A0ABD0V2G6_DENTH
MSGLKIDEAEEAKEGPLPTENCRVISVIPMAPEKEKCTGEMTVEFCMLDLALILFKSCESDYSALQELA